MGRARTDSLGAAEADAAFHRALLAATGNETLARMDMLLEPGLRKRGRLVHAHAPVDEPVPTQRAVFDAVREGDAARDAGRSPLLDAGSTCRRRLRGGAFAPL
ncbi:FCD domain-containing protein [Streptomyces sp. NPDC006617]|uniref:FCD domain-containing protein n=1 Tax=Streptomyces sp. NPDC006617 TaxID=3155354 RepID=UPI0033BB887C